MAPLGLESTKPRTSRNLLWVTENLLFEYIRAIAWKFGEEVGPRSELGDVAASLSRIAITKRLHGLI
jgi:hypothetical protein